MLFLFGRRNKQHEPKQIDQVLEDLFLSQQADRLKEAFISKICAPNPRCSHAEATVMGVLKVSSKWVLHGLNDMQISSGFKLFNFWGSQNPTIFQAFFTPGFVADILSQADGVAANVPLLIRDGFRAMDKVNVRMRLEHTRIVQRHIGKFMGSAQERAVVCNALHLLDEFVECIPLDVRDGDSLYLAVLDHLSVCVVPHLDEEVDENTGYSHMRAATSRILSHMLLGFQHSPESFHQCLEKMSIMIQRLRVEGTPEADQFRHQMSRLIYDLMHQHTGFHELYSPVLKLMQDTPKSADVTDSLNQDKLVSQASGSIVMEANVPSSSITFSISHEMSGPGKTGLVNLGSTSISHEMPGPGKTGLVNLGNTFTSYEMSGPGKTGLVNLGNTSISYEMSGPGKTGLVNLGNTSTSYEMSGPGKTGLVNLGNTCYMNSVLQALYMCDQFRRDVLGKTPDKKETLLTKLQLVFAHLSQSNRPAFSPRQFLQASRPAWFVPGHQQDCSEFLKHLLSELHEEERSAASLSELAVRASVESIFSPETDRMKARILDQAEKMAPFKQPAVERESEIKMYGLKLSDSDSLAKSPDKTLIEGTFRGKVQTTLRCVACSHESLTVESFDDISLAFPNSSVSSFDCHKSLAGGGGTSGSDTRVEGEQIAEAETSSPSLEYFSLDDLISYYLKPENLTGDNKYHCGRCRQLQDGEKQIQIVESPQYLIFTLLRFSYDTKRQTRTKIFCNVNYPRTLKLPVCNSPAYKGPTQRLTKQRLTNDNSTPYSIFASPVDSHSSKFENISNNLASKFENYKQDSSSHLLYGLCGVIIHSGVSSENGHYYCYARHSQTGQINVGLLDKKEDSLDDLDFLPDTWYNFNDGLVSGVTFNSFRNVTKRFSKDTPYILIYRRLDPGGQSYEFADEPVLHPYLRDAVMKDNEAFIKEREAAAKAEAKRRSRMSSSLSSVTFDTWHRRHDHDDDDDVSQDGGREPWERYGLDFGGSRYLF